MVKHFRWLSGAIALMLVSSFAYADAAYTLTGSLVGSTATTETWRITLSIDTSGYTGGGVAISAVAIKISSRVLDSELSATPDGTWSLVPGGLNSSGCSGSGSGFDCADAAGLGALLRNGTLFSWTFDQTIPAGSLLSGPLEASIKAEYVDASGQKVGSLVSTNTTLGVPEPGSILLLGIGLLAVCAGMIAARRFAKKR